MVNHGNQTQHRDSGHELLELVLAPHPVVEVFAEEGKADAEEQADAYRNDSVLNSLRGDRHRIGDRRDDELPGARILCGVQLQLFKLIAEDASLWFEISVAALEARLKSRNRESAKIVLMLLLLGELLGLNLLLGGDL